MVMVLSNLNAAVLLNRLRDRRLNNTVELSPDLYINIASEQCVIILIKQLIYV